MRKLVLAAVAALVLAAPVHAGGGVGGDPAPRVKEPKPKLLRISGAIVRMSEQAVAVENRVGDAVLTCRVPERLAAKVDGFDVGDAVRMYCLRHRGRRAVLLKLVPFEAKRPQKPAERPAGEKREALGLVAELGEAAIVVQTREGRVACRVPAEKLGKLEGLKVGDTVKIWCAGGVLVALERPVPVDKPKPPAGDEVRVYGTIAELSREAVTVRGDAGSLTCRIPAALAEKLARFAVGDAVKMMCRGAELTYLEKTG
jgi:hypothetical protein